MKTLARNKTKIKYALYQGRTRLTKQDGTKGEYINSYGPPTEIKLYVSASRGQADMDMFGVNANYTKVLITDDMSCPINEQSHLWIDDLTGEYDYIVTQVAKSFNCISYAVRKVEVSA